MIAAVVLAVCAALAAGQFAPVENKHGLPELFSYNHGSHSVAVYRGAALKAAIAAGIVKGFPGSQRREPEEDRASRAFTPAPAPRPAPTRAPVPVTPRPTLPPPPPPPAPVCCASAGMIAKEMNDLQRQLAAVQKSVAMLGALTNEIPQCA
jgi:hypothetical protein